MRVLAHGAARVADVREFRLNGLCLNTKSYSRSRDANTFGDALRHVHIRPRNQL